jgi:hypothetical protein
VTRNFDWCADADMQLLASAWRRSASASGADFLAERLS